MISREAMIAELRQALAKEANVFEDSTYLLNPGEKIAIEEGLRDAYTAGGVELGRPDQPGYMDGQFASQLAGYLTAAIDAGLHNYLTTIAPNVCPLYRDLKAKGALISEELELATTILDCLIMAYAKAPVPFIHIAKYVTRKGLLDRYCSCA